MLDDDEVPAVEATPTADPVEPTVSSNGDDDEPQPQPEKKPDGVQKRINELTAKARAAERRAEYAESQLHANHGRNREEPSAPESAAGRPALDQFESYDDYVEALTDWKTDQKLTAREVANEAKRQKSEATETTRTKVFTQVEAGRSEFADFDDVVINNPDLPVSESMTGVLLELEKGHAVAYYLGQNLEEAADIASMSPTRQAIALGRIEAKLAIKSPAKLSKAPAPVGSALAGGASPGKADPTKMTDSEWAKWDAEQNKKSRR